MLVVLLVESREDGLSHRLDNIFCSLDIILNYNSTNVVLNLTTMILIP